MEKPTTISTKKGTGVKGLSNGGGTIIQNPKTINATKQKAPVVKQTKESTNKFPGKGTLVGSDLEKSHKTVENLIDIYGQLG